MVELFANIADPDQTTRFAASDLGLHCLSVTRLGVSSHQLFKVTERTSYIRDFSYCFYIAANRICVAISRVDGALKPWSAIHLRVGNSKQKPAHLDLPVPVM